MRASQKKPPAAKPASAARKPAPPKDPYRRLFIEPAEILLNGPRSAQLIAVTGEAEDGTLRDITSECALSLEDSRIATVQEAVASPLTDGRTQLVVRLGNMKAMAPLTVTGAAQEARYSFVRDVAPVLTKLGCNGSNCHGSPVGKGGFKLSLFGYEPEEDYRAIVHDQNGKRVSLMSPEQSLVVMKPTMGIAHQGGLRMERGSVHYQSILGWLKAGAPEKDASDPALTGMEILPHGRVLTGPKQTQQLIVRARYSDGSLRDITRQATYTSNDEAVAAVDDRGRVTGGNNGEAAIMVRYTNQVDIARLAVATGPAVPASAFPTPNNFIDERVYAKLKALRIAPSPQADDAVFLRRAYLDVVAMLPSPDEVRSFASDTDPKKREKLIEKLLGMPESADPWVLLWSDLLRINRRFMLNDTDRFHGWLQETFRTNRPMNDFAKDILLAVGTPETQPATAFSSQRLFQQPEDRAGAISQLFLGVRIECARCHNHPFEKWTQDDFYGFTAFFAKVAGRGPNQQTPVTVVILPRGDVRNPKTRQLVEPTLLGGFKPTEVPDDRRQAVYDWMVAADNPFFARAMVNRMWKYYFGRGIVDPVDDFRVTNPATNQELLDALAQEFIQSKFDLKHMSRLILNSRVYQQSAQTNESNAKDVKYFARYVPKRMIAECLLDAVCSATEIPERFPNAPAGTRAMQLSTPQGNPGGRGSSYFLDVFGTHPRLTIADRVEEGSVPQALQLINGMINDKVSSRSGRLVRLINAGATDEAIIEELFLCTLSRTPTADEVRKYSELVKSAATRNEGLEDLFWALLGSKEFLFNH